MFVEVWVTCLSSEKHRKISSPCLDNVCVVCLVHCFEFDVMSGVGRSSYTVKWPHAVGLAMFSLRNNVMPLGELNTVIVWSNPWASLTLCIKPWSPYPEKRRGLKLLWTTCDVSCREKQWEVWVIHCHGHRRVWTRIQWKWSNYNFPVLINVSGLSICSSSCVNCLVSS